MVAVLTWHGAEVHEEDLQILRSSTAWLTDRIITFWFEHLRAQQHKDLETEDLAYDRSISFVGAEAAFWLRHETDTEEVAMACDSLGVQESRVVLFPVNNNADSTSANAGTHWSLLSCEQVQVQGEKEKVGAERYWRHYDSGRGINAQVAEAFARKLHALLFEQAKTGPGTTFCFENMNVPQQQNSHDCGLFTLVFAEAILGAGALPAAPPEGNNINDTLADTSSIASLVAAKRSEILRQIDRYRQGI